VLKTQETTIKSLRYGKFTARETILFCPDHKYDGENLIKYDSDELNQLVPPYSNFAYDVIVFVGISRFFHNKQKFEVQEELIIKYGLHISDGGITNLSDRFLIYTKCVHELACLEIQSVIEERGGYILHIDATVEGDSDCIFVGIDSVNGWVLASRKIKSEKEEQITPSLQEIKSQYGEPLAIKRDMGKGMGKAVSIVFPDVIDTICHQHFVRDVGKDILSEQYGLIRKALIAKKIRTRLNRLLEQLIVEISDMGYDVNVTFESFVNCELIELNTNKTVMVYAIVTWILNYPKEGGGLGFPYDMPYVSLYERCVISKNMVDKLVMMMAELKRVYKPLFELNSILEDVDDQKIKSVYDGMKNGRELFTELREVLRIESKSVPLSEGLEFNSESDVFEMMSDLGRFKKKLSEQLQNYGAENREIKIVLEHLEKYWDKLFVTNFEIDPNDSSKDIKMQRTNNISEGFFRKIKANQRRTHGNKDVGQDLNFYGSYLPMVWNLEDEEYVKTVYGSMEKIPVMFSKVTYEMFKNERERFYSERRGRIIRLKHDDSDIFTIIQNSLENFEMQSNGLLML